MEKELEIVKRLTNIKDDKRIVLNDIGWTSRVYVIDNGKIVFKFPRNEDSRRDYKYEIIALELIKDIGFGIDVPKISWITKDNDYIGYYGIEGVSLTEDRVSKLNEEEKIKLGTSIGIFLKKLHLLKPSKPTYKMTVEKEIREYQDKYKMALTTLKKYFNEEQLKIIEAFFMIEMVAKMINLNEDLVFAHGDLGYNNILLTDTNELGVIDFGDAGYYDRSKDFIGLSDEIIKEHAIIAYGNDKTLREKIAIRQKALPILDIPFYVGKKDQAGIDKCIMKIKELT